MTAPEARSAVRAARERLQIDDDMQFASTQRALVPFMPDRTRAGKVEHHTAWVVTLSSAWGFTEVHVEDATGRILNVIRSA
jgi:hypothetical protein